MKVLVFCADLLPLEGLPTSGGGLRSWQMVRSLRGLGHEVIVSIPLFTFLAKKFSDRIPGETRTTAWNPENQDLLVDHHRPDAVLFTSTWIVDHLSPDQKVLRIHDLAGPQLLEMHYKGHLDHAVGPGVKIEKLARSDFVFCAGQRQRYYFWPFLVLAGHELDVPDLLPVVPMACPAELPVHEYPDRIEIVTGGGFYPWQDPSESIRAVRDVLRNQSSSRARLRIFGTSHGVTGSDDEKFERIRSEVGQDEGIEFHDFLPREEYFEICRRASLAIDLQARNPERELAVSTRTIDALWCGLGVLYNDYGELAEPIRKYDAGWTVDPSDGSAIRAVLTDILEHPERIPRKGRNAQALIQDSFLDSGAIRPLAEFLSSPCHRSKPEPAKILPMHEHRELTQSQTIFREVAKSRASRAASALDSLRRFWIGNQM